MPKTKKKKGKQKEKWWSPVVKYGPPLAAVAAAAYGTHYLMEQDWNPQKKVLNNYLTLISTAVRRGWTTIPDDVEMKNVDTGINASLYGRRIYTEEDYNVDPNEISLEPASFKYPIGETTSPVYSEADTESIDEDRPYW